MQNFIFTLESGLESQAKLVISFDPQSLDVLV